MKTSDFNLALHSQTCYAGSLNLQIAWLTDPIENVILLTRNSIVNFGSNLRSKDDGLLSEMQIWL
ncbi:hypothetical protein [Aliivibrio fischeri]